VVESRRQLYALGLGVAIRMRGGSDWEFSTLLAESRLFLCVMRSRYEGSDAIARTAAPRRSRPNGAGSP